MFSENNNSGMINRFALRNIKVPLKWDVSKTHEYDSTAFALALEKLKKSGLCTKLGKPALHVHKKSVDARKRDCLYFVYTVMAEFEKAIVVETEFEKKLYAFDIGKLCTSTMIDAIVPENRMPLMRPVVVGFGPCGMFLSLVLARAGLRPIVIERGESVENRAKSVEDYWQMGKLNSESNVQFGEGGAGTFSDGKLLTRINDPLCSFVLETFCRHGADPDILVNAKPHIGTDKLREIVKSMRNEIIKLGADVHFDTRLENITFDSSGEKVHISTNSEANGICTDALFLCLGHSARDTFSMLAKCGIELAPKAFSVGVRIEHLQKNIDKSLYGDFCGHPALPKGEYALSHRKEERAVYTFCMCPGGTVVASASEDGTIVTNGMSYNARDGKNANSAVAVSVSTSDLERPSDPFCAIEFQHKIERAAYDMCTQKGAAPIMTISDFYGGKKAESEVSPTYTGKTEQNDIKKIFPLFVSEMLAEGFEVFDRRLKGFCDGGAVLTAPETRTSSPVRIPRNSERICAKFPCVYPCGEGAGYAGGITSAAVDGINSALFYIEKLMQQE